MLPYSIRTGSRRPSLLGDPHSRSFHPVGRARAMPVPARAVLSSSSSTHKRGVTRAAGSNESGCSVTFSHSLTAWAAKFRPAQNEVWSLDSWTAGRTSMRNRLQPPRWIYSLSTSCRSGPTPAEPAFSYRHGLGRAARLSPDPERSRRLSWLTANSLSGVTSLRLAPLI